MTPLQEYRKLLKEWTDRAERAANARAKLAPGSSRARVTTANARWMTACEARDRYAERVRQLEDVRELEE